MKKGIAKFTAFCLAAGLTFGEGGVVLLAAAPDQALVGLSSVSKRAETPSQRSGEAVVDEAMVGLASTSVKKEAEETTETTEETAALTAETSEVSVSESEASEVNTDHSIEDGAEGLDTSMVGTTGFAQCGDYVNVRSGASADSEALGKIYNNGSMEILDVDANGWYYVRSGNLEGYVSPDYVAIGEAAETIASETGYTTAQTGVDALNVRAEASADGELMATIDSSHSMEVVANEGDWVKVLVDGEMYGYVSADYVSTTTEYATGETAQEEEERLNQEWLAYLAEEEAKQAAAEAEWLAYLASQQTQQTYTYTDTSADTYNYTTTAASTTGDLTSDCQNAYDAYVAAQDAADAAVANGADEQTVIDTAAAAQNAYGTYVNLQNQVDAAAVAEANAAYTQTAEAASADTTAADTTTAEATYTEAAYTETAAETVTAETATVSSAGQSVADFACQFVGNPYVWGGSSLTNGADCSGFTMAVYANFGISLPHNAAAQSGYGTAVSLDSLQPGDLLFYNGSGGIGHVSMYIGNGQVVHASNPTNGILISSIGYRTPCAARRLL